MSICTDCNEAATSSLPMRWRIGSEEVAALEAHLAVCDPCRQVLLDTRRIITDLPLSISLVEPPPFLKARILAGLDRTRSSNWTVRETLRGFRREVTVLVPVRYGRTLVASVALFTFLAFGLVIYQSTRLDMVQGHNRELETPSSNSGARSRCSPTQESPPLRSKETYRSRVPGAAG